MPLLGRSTHKSRYTKYPSQTLIPRITLFAIFLSFSSPPLHPCRFIRPPLSLYPPPFLYLPLLPSCFLFARVLDCLFVAMAQDTTKLCDFTNTNNNDFLSTPNAPLNDVESCEINVALLNLVMKDQFSGLPSEDAATHLNNLEIVLKLCFRLCLN